MTYWHHVGMLSPFLILSALYFFKNIMVSNDDLIQNFLNALELLLSDHNTLPCMLHRSRRFCWGPSPSWEGSDDPFSPDHGHPMKPTQMKLNFCLPPELLFPLPLWNIHLSSQFPPYELPDFSPPYDMPVLPAPHINLSIFLPLELATDSNGPPFLDSATDLTASQTPSE